MPDDPAPTPVDVDARSGAASASGTDPHRTIGLFGATVIGVGAIVGGGILALVGVAFDAAGPAAFVAFALNGVVAILTALSFAELSARFPHSGGTYAFAKRVLSVRAAFTLGWIVYFASIVAGVLYALGFAEYAVLALAQSWSGAPPWLLARPGALLLAVAAIAFYTATQVRRAGGGGAWTTVGKVVVFGVLIAAGLAVLVGRPAAGIADTLRPFAPSGFGGILAAMGFTFIAFQGFDLIAASAGEIKSPGRTIPRAMLISLAVALTVYLPLLLVIATVGVPSEFPGVQSFAGAFPETVMAVAARTYLGALGFWLVIVAALLSMLSALEANLYAASRIAFAMARDRTLPARLGRVSGRGIPVAGVLASALTMVATMIALPNVAAAGAAASLIFLIVFTLAHGIAILARGRDPATPIPFKTPWFPLVPIVGGIATAGLAIFQGFTVPVAGGIALVWSLAGLGIYLWLFAREARIADAHAEAQDPSLVALRGRRPLVLAPIVNPASAGALVGVADALAPERVGRVMLLSVVSDARPEASTVDGVAHHPSLANAQAVLEESLGLALEAGLSPEALITLASDPWDEIARAARLHDCESLLLGFAALDDADVRRRVNDLISEVDSDVVVLRAPAAWRFERVERVLIPVGGQGAQEALRARLLGTLARIGSSRAIYLRVLPSSTTDASLGRAQRSLERFADTVGGGTADAVVVRGDDPKAVIAEHAAACDLMILGLQRTAKGRKRFGGFTRELAAATPESCAILFISARG